MYFNSRSCQPHASLTFIQTDVLVAPKRVVKRFVGLTHDEVTDLFVSAQKVLSAIEREYSATSCTLAIQVIDVM